VLDNNIIANNWLVTMICAYDISKAADMQLARIGEVEEVAGAAVFLASKAGSYITGVTIVIDGGLTSAGRSISVSTSGA